jgi:hypothetical protein
MHTRHVWLGFFTSTICEDSAELDGSIISCSNKVSNKSLIILFFSDEKILAGF